jgi:hypothetical protein
LHDGVSPRHEIEKSCPEKRQTAISQNPEKLSNAGIFPHLEQK